MLSGPPLKPILLFGLPILVSNVFQMLYSIVDSIVVGNYVGADALAAVGSSTTLANLLVALASGLTVGASVVVSQFFGAGQKEKVKASISTSIIFMVILGAVLSVLGVATAGLVTDLCNVPKEIFGDSVTYIRIYMSGLIFMLLYNYFASILRALGDSTTPLVFLIISSLLNVALDLFFVIALGLGVAGVAWATVISQALSVILCAVYVRFKVEVFQFEKSEFRFDKEQFRNLLRLGVPSAIQGSITSIGFVFVQALINSFGSVNIAAYTAATKMEILAHLPVESFAMSLSVFVGQNMGAGLIERTKKGMWSVTIFNIIISGITTAIIFLTCPILIGLFVKSGEAEVIALGSTFLKIVAPFIFIEALMQGFSSVLRGSGDSVMAMAAMMCDLGLRMILSFVFSLGLGIGFFGCAWAIPCGWGAALLVGFIRYRSGKWQKMTVV